jgi:hypothetical protein
VNVRRSIWHGREQAPKTPNAVRVVDIAEPLAGVLREYVAGKADSAYLFSARNGRPLEKRNAHRVLHATGKKVGFHAFRRFRTETLVRARVPEDLTRLWLGHSKQTVTDLYAVGLEKDEAWRREWCERVGLGFSLVGLLGLQNAVPTDAVKVAQTQCGAGLEVARPERFELPTLWFEARCSIQLSYGRVTIILARTVLPGGCNVNRKG